MFYNARLRACGTYSSVSRCNTDYGFPINGPIGLKYKLLPYVKSILGLNLYNYFYYRIKSASSDVYDVLVSNHSKLKDISEIVDEVNLDINMKISQKINN